MKSTLIRACVLAAIALPALPALAFTGVSGLKSAAPSGIEHVANKYECFTDDGYGRKFPCSARYKRENPQWRNSNDCFTDEGYGRYRPCDSFFKRPAAAKN